MTHHRLLTAMAGLAALVLFVTPARAQLPEGGNGIAANYPGDLGIANYSEVLFVEDFEEGSVPAVTARRPACSDPVCQDNDGDGYGDPADNCTPHRAGLHPGATEVCDNGVDDNYDGTAACHLSSSFSPRGWRSNGVVEGLPKSLERLTIGIPSPLCWGGCLVIRIFGETSDGEFEIRRRESLRP